MFEVYGNGLREENWEPYQLKPRDIEVFFSFKNYCFDGKEGNGGFISASCGHWRQKRDTLR